MNLCFDLWGGWAGPNRRHALPYDPPPTSYIYPTHRAALLPLGPDAAKLADGGRPRLPPQAAVAGPDHSGGGLAGLVVCVLTVLLLMIWVGLLEVDLSGSFRSTQTTQTTT